MKNFNLAIVFIISGMSAVFIISLMALFICREDNNFDCKFRKWTQQLNAQHLIPIDETGYCRNDLPSEGLEFEGSEAEILFRSNLTLLAKQSLKKDYHWKICRALQAMTILRIVSIDNFLKMSNEDKNLLIQKIANSKFPIFDQYHFENNQYSEIARLFKVQRIDAVKDSKTRMTIIEPQDVFGSHTSLDNRQSTKHDHRSHQ